jgi:hypothetical protein
MKPQRAAPALYRVSMTRARLWLALTLALAGCDGCVRHGSTPRCGHCDQSPECANALACVNGVCETAPPSCHVDIGL